MKAPKLTPVGFIAKVHGYKGQVVLALEHFTPDALKNTKFLFVELEGLPVPFCVEELLTKGDDLILKFEMINDEGQAKRLIQQTVFAEKMTIRENVELDWPDLVGFTAFDKTYGRMGLVEEIEELPMQWIAHCMINEKEILFPLNEQVLIDIDEEKKELHLDLHDGLIQVYLDH